VTFADIDPDSLTLDPAAVEAAITPDTEAIIATHVYGNPCDVDALGKIARKHGIALVYDAAHAFGVRFEGRSLLEHGDASILSSHATKLFHTAEGGFAYARDHQVSRKIEWMRRYAHDGEGSFHGIGTNAKLSELHAAMGLLVLEGLPGIFEARRGICSRYDRMLSGVSGVRQAFQLRPGTEWNQVYYPVIFDTEGALLAVQAAMNTRKVFPRRYFHPSLSQIPVLGGSGHCPVAESVADRVLCLPLADTLTDADCDRVIDAFLSGLPG
jgi:dTDP-4-amino-4,6-dideoxygalactose transaminase